jgi:hypothetical protein
MVSAVNSLECGERAAHVALAQADDYTHVHLGAEFAE